MGHGRRELCDAHCPVVVWYLLCVVGGRLSPAIHSLSGDLVERDQWEEVEVWGGEARRGSCIWHCTPFLAPIDLCRAQGVTPRGSLGAGRSLGHAQKLHRTVRFYFIIRLSTFRGCHFWMNELDCFSALWVLSCVANPVPLADN